MTFFSRPHTRLGLYDPLREAMELASSGTRHLQSTVYSGIDAVYEMARVIRPAPEVILGKQENQQTAKKVSEPVKVQTPASGKASKGKTNAGGSSLKAIFSALARALSGQPRPVFTASNNDEEEEDGFVLPFCPTARAESLGGKIPNVS
jgi:hypothetical protein